MRLVLTLTVLLVAARASLADYRPGYRQPYYVKEVVQKVYVAESVLVPVVVPSALLVNLAPAAAPPPVTIAPQALVEAQGNQAAVLERMAALERKLDQLLGGPPMPLAAPTAPAKPTLQQVAGIAKVMCAQCHSGKHGRGGVQLFNDAGEYAANIPPSVMAAAVRNDRMPAGPDKLRPADKALIEAWAKGGN